MATRQRSPDPNAPTELIGPPPPGEPPEPPPERELWPWLLVLLLLVLAGLAAAWFATRDSGGASSPPRTRLTTVAAPAAQPKPRTNRPTTTAVTQVTVPDLVGQQRDDAVRTLEAQGLKASVNEVPSDQETGVVVAQAPHGGTKVDKGSSVAVNVSKGPSTPAPATVTVPDVVGQSKDAARDAIKAAGLEPSTEHVPSAQSKDTVVSQSPGGGSSAHEGDHVLINISEGPPKKVEKSKAKPTKRARSQQPATGNVPSVIGEDEVTAQADLQSAGFSVSSVDQPTSDSSRDGLVVDQSPSGGSDADSSSTVTIYVARYNGG